MTFVLFPEYKDSCNFSPTCICTSYTTTIAPYGMPQLYTPVFHLSAVLERADKHPSHCQWIII